MAEGGVGAAPKREEPPPKPLVALAEDGVAPNVPPEAQRAVAGAVVPVVDAEAPKPKEEEVVVPAGAVEEPPKRDEPVEAPKSEAPRGFAPPKREPVEAGDGGTGEAVLAPPKPGFAAEPKPKPVEEVVEEPKLNDVAAGAVE